MLEIDDVHVEFRTRSRGIVRAVDGVTLAVRPGTIVGLVGESGCGKSTLARAVMGLEKVTSGAIRLGGEKVGALGWHQRRGNDLRMQMIFQNPYASLNPRRTIGSQISDGLRLPEDVADPEVAVARLLGLVGLEPKLADRYPHQFSGGQRQRVAIARALATSPDILIADEPVTALDASSQAQVVNLLTDLVETLGVGILFISHDLALVQEIADEVAVMYLGRIVEAGRTREVWNQPQHPYTRALVAALPRISDNPTLPTSLKGEVPDAANIPAGCRFRPRCPFATDQCLSDPPRVEREASWSMCWFPREARSATKEIGDIHA